MFRIYICNAIIASNGWLILEEIINNIEITLQYPKGQPTTDLNRFLNGLSGCYWNRRYLERCADLGHAAVLYLIKGRNCNALQDISNKFVDLCLMYLLKTKPMYFSLLSMVLKLTIYFFLDT